MKKLLVVIDYQNDFVTGSLGFEKAKALETHLCHQIKEYKDNGHPVLFTLDTHQKDYMETQEGKYLPIPHCIENSEGWKIYGEVGKLVDIKDKQIKKFTFGSLELGNYLKEHSYDEITFVGVVSNICVVSNAIIAKAALPEATINIDYKGTASNDESMHEKAMAILAGLQMNIINKD